MRELIFLQRHENKWRDLEKMLLMPGKKDPDKLSELYIQLNDDLSYARTFYPESNTVKYLNDLSVQLHKEIYQNKREKGSRIRRFFTEELPDIMVKQNTYMAITAAVFLLAILLGWISAANDLTYTRLVMGDEYVDQTLENIRSGKAMNIYGQTAEGAMFLGIAFNNLYVTIMYFLLGLVAGLGALAFLFRFGMYLGSFFQLMYSQGVLGETMLAIWIHGVIEISCILIACAAGTRWGMSLVFPGTYSRSSSFTMASRDMFKVLFGILPLIVLAAFIEGIVTRHYDENIFISIAIILLTLAFILFYFVIYPLSRRNKALKQRTEHAIAQR